MLHDLDLPSLIVFCKSFLTFAASGKSNEVCHNDDTIEMNLLVKFEATSYSVPARHLRQQKQGNHQEGEKKNTHTKKNNI